MDHLLEVRGLATHFFAGGRVLKAVDGVDLTLEQGETLGIVGETGCGKSVMALSVMRLIPWPPGKIVAGSVVLEGDDLLQKSEADMRAIRGRKIAMIFQEPRTSMNPVFRIGQQMAQVIALHHSLTKKRALVKAIEMLERVNIASADRIVRMYPHELSGGMLQRAMIAMQLSCNPTVLLADEPTTALDVTIQAQILKLLKELQAQMQMAIVFITHDLGVVAQLCDRVMVMYAGSFVESARVEDLFDEPLHPYTRGLLGAIPRLDEAQDELAIIPGGLPDIGNLPPGCKFLPRCSYAVDQCRALAPRLVEVKPGRLVAACSLYGNGR